jgi:hypothetical protein
MKSGPFWWLVERYGAHPIAGTAICVGVLGFTAEMMGDGLGWGNRFAVGAVIVQFLTIPFFLPVYLQAERRRKRERRGLCTACGYDLRATPERCPWCGRVPRTQAARFGVARV